MSGPRFRIDEILPADGSEPSAGELAEVVATARELEWFAASETGEPSASFVERVMAELPASAPVAAEGSRNRLAVVIPITRRRSGAAGSRSDALTALLAAALVIVGLGAVAVVGGSMGLFDTDRSPEPSLPSNVLESPSPTLTSEPSPSLSPSPSPSASPSDTPGITAPPTKTPGTTSTPSPTRTPTSEPTGTPEGSDDHGGGNKTPRPSSSGSNSGPGSGGSSTPKPG